MIRFCVAFATIAIATLMTGCRAPAPTIDPYAAHGSPRIAPPGTGSFGDSYYPGGQQNQSQPVGATSSAPQDQVSVLADSPAPTQAGWQRVGHSAATTLATDSTAVGTGLRPTALEAGNTTATARASLEANPSSLEARIAKGRMQINDATTIRGQNQFQPPTIPASTQPAAARRQPNQLSPIPAGTAPSLLPVPNAGDGAATTPGWRAKYTATGVDGFAAR